MFNQYFYLLGVLIIFFALLFSGITHAASTDCSGLNEKRVVLRGSSGRVDVLMPSEDECRPLAFAGCSYINEKALFLRDLGEPVNVRLTSDEDCNSANITLELYSQSKNGWRVLYQTSGHPRKYIGFSARRVTPKQLPTVLDNLLGNFIRPVKLEELLQQDNCKSILPEARTKKLIDDRNWLYPLPRGLSDYHYIAYLEELNQYVHVATCARAREPKIDLKGVVQDKEGVQYFSPVYKERVNRWAKSLRDTAPPIRSMDDMPEWEKYAHKKCKILEAPFHQLKMGGSDACNLNYSSCDEATASFNRGEQVVINLYCAANTRKECFDKSLWQDEKRFFSFAEDIDYATHTLNWRKINDNEPINRACVHWN